MTADIVVPTLGESVTEATVAQWLKQPGEAVQVDDALVELETDKVTLEVNASTAGVLSEILAGEGDSVEVGAILGRIGEGTGTAPTAAAKAPVPAEAVPAPAAAAAESKTGGGDGDRAVAESLSPAVRKLIADNALDPHRIVGSGKDGRITKEDVLAAIA
ncbi:MAG: biotin/lipoyl-containing protein, partial [Alphaproteobacteria bacterium]